VSGDGEKVRIAQAKGRPMLQWVGKRPLREVRSFPAQLIERFTPDAPAGAVSKDVDWSDWPDRFDRGGLLFHGDNKEVLAHLLANGFRGKVDLVYIDPPFDSGADYVRKVQLRGAPGSARIDGESHTLGEQIQYTDIWANDNYLQFMYERLLLIKELMSPDATMYLHVDTNRSHLLKIVLDEVFGADSFLNEVIWQRTTAHADTRGRFGEIHDALLVYVRSSDQVWNPQHILYSDDYRDSKYVNVEDGTGRRYRLGDMTAPGPRPNLEYEWRGVRPPAGRCWAVNRERMQQHERDGRLVYSKTGMPQYKRYLDEMAGVPLQDIWRDIPPVNPMALEKLGFPTQKPEALLDRVIRASSNPGDIVLDCFIGSGTTAAVAQKLGRRWIGADINRGAIQTTEKRLAAIIEGQAAAATGEQLMIEDGATPRPAQLCFAVHRVNDYDLQIQHNEAVNLAVEHLGAERSKTDLFFQGTLGRELLAIVAFNHPCTPLDLQTVARELELRPDEPRDAVVVCLGRELACEGWLDNHNRLRPINKIRLIELRTDPKYGKFFEHRPAAARVTFTPAGDRVRVRVDDFVSPSIIERLSGQEGVLAPQIADWRAMVDSVFIDPAFDGEVFNVGLADIPERKQDLVDGEYLLARSDSGPARPVAVRITDMLGEEVLVVEER
jgi:adenine-specific DNA-methyltransferase